MVDKLWDAARAFRCGAEPRAGWSETEECAAAVEDSEVAAAESDDVIAGLKELGEADQLADDSLADERELARHLISPRVPTRRTWCSASYHGSSRRSGIVRGEGA